MVNTLKISHQLQEAGEEPRVADTLAYIMADLLSSELASKENLHITELTLQKEMELTRLSLQKDIEQTRLSLQKEMEGVRLDIKSLEVQLTDKMNVHVRWVAGFFIGQTALLYALYRLIG